MSLYYPTFDELNAQIIAEFRVQLPNIDPTVFGSWAMAFATGNAVLAQSISFLVRDLEIQMFPQTATGEFLDQWGWYEDIPRLEASGADGLVSVTGTAGLNIPQWTAFTGSNGIAYLSTQFKTIIENTQAITNLTSSGTTAIAVCGTDHNLSTGMIVDISGANFAPYNVANAVITVTTAISFRYTMLSSTTSPDTGSPEWDASSASVPVASIPTGVETNMGSGGQLIFDTEISGVDTTALVQNLGLTGGADEESDEAYRNRIILSRSIREGVFTPDQIRLAVFSIPGNTRAWVKKPTITGVGGATDPYPGQCSVFFLRDNDPNIIPVGTKLTLTYEAIKESGALPANMVAGDLPSDADLFVQGPTLVESNFVFSDISPDTPTMRTAIENTLQAFFDDTVEFEENVTGASYLGAIQNTQDLETGDWLSTFTLSTPASPYADIAVSDGEIATLGTVTFP